MRILVLNWQDHLNPQAGGAELHLQQTFSRIAARGHSVDLLCSSWGAAPQRATLDGIEVHRVGTRNTYPFLARRYVVWQERKVVQLADATMAEVTSSGNGGWALGADDRPYRVLVGYGATYADHFLVNLADGTRKPVLRKTEGALTLSPGGRHALTWHYPNSFLSTTYSLTQARNFTPFLTCSVI